MVRFPWFIAALLGVLMLPGSALLAQAGTVSGVVYDKDFDSPLGAAQVLCVQLNLRVQTSDTGNYQLGELAPGTYTLVFSKPGYVQVVKSDVIVTPGQVTEVHASLEGEFTELEEFIVQEALQLTPGSDAALLKMRFESPALLDSIGSDLMNRAGVSDAAGALKLVAGASVKDGKSAVIRGLPDRYVSSQMNGVRLPTADEDKRAVELDQFPSTVIEQISVSKTFTPDQQGDASGGAVNVRLKSIPKKPWFLKLKASTKANSQVAGEDDFLTYNGGGVNFWGRDDDRDQQLDLLGSHWTGAVGTETERAPFDLLSKFSIEGGGSHDFGNGFRVGGSASFFWEREYKYFDNGIDDKYWVANPMDPLTPQLNQDQGGDDFKTSLFDVTQGAQAVQWGTLLTFGVEYEEDHAVNLTYLFTRTTEDKSTLAVDTRGKEFFFPGHDPNDPTTPGHAEPDAAPYLRLETLEYTERETETLQFRGRHKIPTGEFGPFKDPSVDWTVAFSSADLNQPDKRQFGALWQPAREPIPGFILPAAWRPYKPDANFTLGNVQRIWKEISEESDQYAFNLSLPFDQWDGYEGYLKFGYFIDSVDRTFDQDTFSNFNDNSSFDAGFDTPWSSVFPFEDHPISDGPPFVDVDYEGELTVDAWYAMADVPILENLRVRGGVRFESTEIGIINDPEADANWFPPNGTGQTQLNPGDGDVSFDQSDVLPSVAVEYRPVEGVIVRGSYNETIARQTFKELTPIIQQEFLGGPIFIGNPALGMSSVKNYDIRVDYNPSEGGLVSASWFHKDIKSPIEYVQRVDPFSYTTAVNYPEGELSGFELEVKQRLGHFVEDLDGLTIGANATIIDSEVKLPDDEIAAFSAPNIMAPMSAREMTNAPEFLFNAFLTYDIAATGTQFALFYTLQGDTLVAGAGEAGGNFVPSVFATEFDTLNVSVSQRIGEHFKLQLQAKNLTNPEIETVYRTDYTDERRKTSFTKGIEYSISLSAEFTF